LLGSLHYPDPVHAPEDKLQASLEVALAHREIDRNAPKDFVEHAAAKARITMSMRDD
jgi:hypothetical protein